MIAKISSTDNLGGALSYNFKKVEKGEANILLAAELYQSKEGRYTMEDVLADMEALIPKNCRTKKTVFHCSLNPHPDEKLSDETLTQIVKEYMEALGYGKQPYIVFKHNDIAREHIHIVSLRVDSKGRKISDKFEKRRSKKITEALERKYDLIPSSKIADKVMNETPKIDTTRGNIKEQVASILRMVLKRYCLCSLGELNAILSAYNLAVEEVKTEFQGKKYDGVRCQTKVHNCKYSYLLCSFILLFSEILLLIEFCFIISLILLISSPWPKYIYLGVRLSNDS